MSQCSVRSPAQQGVLRPLSASTVCCSHPWNIRGFPVLSFSGHSSFTLSGYPSLSHSGYLRISIEQGYDQLVVRTSAPH
jgi:hypothetical protein